MPLCPGTSPTGLPCILEDERPIVTKKATVQRLKATFVVGSRPVEQSDLEDVQVDVLKNFGAIPHTCRSDDECVCDRGQAPIPGRMCNVHHERAERTEDKPRLEAARAASLVQKAADDAAYEAKIAAAIAAKKWAEVPIGRLPSEALKANGDVLPNGMTKEKK